MSLCGHLRGPQWHLLAPSAVPNNLLRSESFHGWHDPLGPEARNRLGATRRCQPLSIFAFVCTGLTPTRTFLAREVVKSVPVRHHHLVLSSSRWS
eukprot:1984043-Rhodomonas_salina.3